MITYKQAGVDINKAKKFKDWIKKKAKKIGFFSGFYEFNDKLLVATCDGVGTKIKISQLLNVYDTIGIDLVAMNVNDILTCGAKPLFFLDYIAMGKLNLKILKEIMNGILKGCKLANIELLGGETAEMPNLYAGDDFDLAGFAIGILNKKSKIIGENITVGDVIIGLPSSGLHSNGFSLIRKIFTKNEIKKYSKILLEPTRIYTEEIEYLLKEFQPNKEIKAIVHITGGAFYDNILRILKNSTKAIIYKDSWTPQPIFDIIKQKTKLTTYQLYRTFNMGIGMVIIIDRKIKEKVSGLFDSKEIGEIIEGKKEVKVI